MDEDDQLGSRAAASNFFDERHIIQLGPVARCLSGK